MPPDRAELRRRAEEAAEALVPEDLRLDRECPICGYVGRFGAMASDRGVRLEARCPSCGALERHRHLMLCLARDAALRQLGHLVHFAPEPALRGLVEPFCTRYQSADLNPRKGDIVLDIESINLPDASVDTFLCNHVLEHVDDARALAELHRVLVPGGRAILTVPIVMTWELTHEVPGLSDASLRRLHYGQRDHVRRYGRDFPDRVAAAGFAVAGLIARPLDCARHGLSPASVIFVATRPR